jgi:hypothetical protein
VTGADSNLEVGKWESALVREVKVWIRQTRGGSGLKDRGSIHPRMEGGAVADGDDLRRASGTT